MEKREKDLVVRLDQDKKTCAAREADAFEPRASQAYLRDTVSGTA
jgi:hypothetical protein